MNINNACIELNIVIQECYVLNTVKTRVKPRMSSTLCGLKVIHELIVKRELYLIGAQKIAYFHYRSPRMDKHIIVVLIVHLKAFQLTLKILIYHNP